VGENRAAIQEVNVQPDNLESLRRYLDGLGISREGSNALVEAAVSDDKDAEGGGRLRALIGKIASETGKLAPEVAKMLIEAAIAKWTGG
jgi:hypothetical protein